MKKLISATIFLVVVLLFLGFLDCFYDIYYKIRSDQARLQLYYLVKDKADVLLPSSNIKEKEQTYRDIMNLIQSDKKEES